MDFSIKSPPSGTIEKTEIIKGTDDVISGVIRRWRKTTEKMDSYVDKFQPKLLITDKTLFQGVLNLADRGIKTRPIFEITEDNTSFVKGLINVFGIDAFRHLDNVAGNFLFLMKRYTKM